MDMEEIPSKKKTLQFKDTCFFQKLMSRSNTSIVAKNRLVHLYCKKTDEKEMRSNFANEPCKKGFCSRRTLVVGLTYILILAFHSNGRT